MNQKQSSIVRTRTALLLRRDGTTQIVRWRTRADLERALASKFGLNGPYSGDSYSELRQLYEDCGDEYMARHPPVLFVDRRSRPIIRWEGSLEAASELRAMWSDTESDAERAQAGRR